MNTNPLLQTKHAPSPSLQCGPALFDDFTSRRAEVLTLGLTGLERYDVEGVAGGVTPGKRLTARARADDGAEKTFTVICRIDTPVEVDYYNHGGILPFVLRQLVKA